jgi:hypothetical protein
MARDTIIVLDSDSEPELCPKTLPDEHHGRSMSHSCEIIDICSPEKGDASEVMVTTEDPASYPMHSTSPLAAKAPTHYCDPVTFSDTEVISNESVSLCHGPMTKLSGDPIWHV